MNLWNSLPRGLWILSGQVHSRQRSTDLSTKGIKGHGDGGGSGVEVDDQTILLNASAGTKGKWPPPAPNSYVMFKAYFWKQNKFYV